MSVFLERSFPPWMAGGSFSLHAASALPADHPPVTSVHVFARCGGRVVLVDVAARGWDIPGGHVEAGEGIVDAARRELAEEAGDAVVAAVSELRVCGFALLDASDAGESSLSPYPRRAVMVFVVAAAAELVTLAPTLEVRAAAWVTDVTRRCAGRSWLPLWEHLNAP